MNWWPWNDSIYVNYTVDFDACMDGCAQWNLNNNTEVCVGVSFIDSFGPGGDAGGRECIYKWRMLEPGSPDVLSNSAQLQFNTVCHI